MSEWATNICVALKLDKELLSKENEFHLFSMSSSIFVVNVIELYL